MQHAPAPIGSEEKFVTVPHFTRNSISPIPQNTLRIPHFAAPHCTETPELQLCIPQITGKLPVSLCLLHYTSLTRLKHLATINLSKEASEHKGSTET